MFFLILIFSVVGYFIGSRRGYGLYGAIISIPLGPIGWFIVGSKKPKNSASEDDSPSVAATPAQDSSSPLISPVISSVEEKTVDAAVSVRATAGGDDWLFEAKPIPRWKILIGEGVFRSSILDFVKYSQGNLTVQVSSGKQLCLPFMDTECSYQYTIGDSEDFVSAWAISVRSKTDPKRYVKFEANTSQMPKEWWVSLRDKLGASEHQSAMQKIGRAVRLKPSAEKLSQNVGPLPDNYQELVSIRIKSPKDGAGLVDPHSAIIEFPSPPEKGWTGPVFDRHIGWVGEAWVNAKNRMGGYAGPSPLKYCISHGVVVYIRLSKEND